MKRLLLFLPLLFLSGCVFPDNLCIELKDINMSDQEKVSGFIEINLEKCPVFVEGIMDQVNQTNLTVPIQLNLSEINITNMTITNQTNITNETSITIFNQTNSTILNKTINITEE